jgi:peptidoglycan biosynthesis protein MviN/MurJ (putative lipid II flippase)
MSIIAIVMASVLGLVLILAFLARLGLRVRPRPFLHDRRFASP